MPELPEVETVRQGLAPMMVGKRLDRLELRRADLRYPFPADFTRIDGQVLGNIHRRAKFLLFEFERNWVIGHLGMSGSFRAIDDEETPQKHDHVLFHFNDITVAYHDPRRFGAMDLCRTDGSHEWLDKLGPEPLSNGFDGEYLAAVLAGRKAPIKSALLDQRVVAGLGNIYVCEALWEAGISPERIAGNLSKDEVEILVQKVREVLRLAIKSGGSTLRDHRQADGTLGYFQHRFKVYGREGENCARQCGAVNRIVQSGRSSFYCDKCQK